MFILDTADSPLHASHVTVNLRFFNFCFLCCLATKRVPVPGL